MQSDSGCYTSIKRIKVCLYTKKTDSRLQVNTAILEAF